MFTGNQSTSLDDKGRLILPAKMRAEVEAGSPAREVYLVPWLEECIAVYLPARWDEMAAKIDSNPFELEESRRVSRQIFSFVEKGTFDRQWRLVMPRGHLSYAGIERELIVSGVRDHMELWSPKAWSEKVTKHTLEDDLKAIFDKLKKPSGQ